MKDIFKVHNIDARKLEDVIKKPIVDVTITSPPYFDLKDYGYKKQIGFGQNYDEYLDDLKAVFSQVFRVTKNTGTLWVIIDAFRKNGEVVPLPFDFANKIKDVGWKLQEIIVWGKDRTVPWTHKGQMRNLFEYILMFSKTDDYKFYVDEIRDTETLKKWWVKYPERYNPKGKTPDAIWNFDIPQQGAWGKSYVRHFCPLPEEMIEQMLKLTTKERDVVLDCFSGSGAVLSKADNMKRKYIGFELNKSYIKMFDSYLKKTGLIKRKEYEIEKKNTTTQSKFEKLIIDLRALKFARILYKKAIENNINGIERIYVEKSNRKPKKSNQIIVINYYLLVNNNIDKKEIIKICSNKPLSNFGIEAKFNFVKKDKLFYNLLNRNRVYTYTSAVTHKYSKLFKKKDELNNSDLIFSKIKVDLNEKDYE